MSRNKHWFKTLWVVSVLSVGAWPAFAVEAPVFEADDYSQEGGDSGQGGGAVTSPAAPLATPQATQPDESSGGTSDDEAPVSTLTQGQRIDRLEQQLDNLQHAESSTRLNHFQEEIQALRGRVDELSHLLEQMQKRQQAMYTDLDRRIVSKPVSAVAAMAAALPATHKKVPALPVTGPKTAAAAKANQPNVAEEQQTYQLAYDLIKAEKYDQAVSALQEMLRKYPSGQFAANAHYWLGELYGLQGKNALSAVEFQTVLKQYPGSPRMADAGLKLGLIYAAEFKWREAKGAFHNVINRYPGTASARLAAEQLKQIRQSAH